MDTKSNDTYYVFCIFILCLLVFTSIPTLCAFIYYRRHMLIRIRVPILGYCIGVFTCFCPILIVLREVQLARPDAATATSGFVPCSLVNWSSNMYVGFVANGYMLRAFHLCALYHPDFRRRFPQFRSVPNLHFMQMGSIIGQITVNKHNHQHTHTHTRQTFIPGLMHRERGREGVTQREATPRFS